MAKRRRRSHSKSWLWWRFFLMYSYWSFYGWCDHVELTLERDCLGEWRFEIDLARYSLVITYDSSLTF